MPAAKLIDTPEGLAVLLTADIADLREKETLQMPKKKLSHIPLGFESRLDRIRRCAKILDARFSLETSGKLWRACWQAGKPWRAPWHQVMGEEDLLSRARSPDVALAKIEKHIAKRLLAATPADPK